MGKDVSIACSKKHYLAIVSRTSESHYTPLSERWVAWPDVNHVSAKYKDLQHSTNWARLAVATYCQRQLINFEAQVFQMMFMYTNFVLSM
jgi:hypothetical protein